MSAENQDGASAEPAVYCSQSFFAGHPSHCRCYNVSLIKLMWEMVGLISIFKTDSYLEKNGFLFIKFSRFIPSRENKGLIKGVFVFLLLLFYAQHIYTKNI